MSLAKTVLGETTLRMVADYVNKNPEITAGNRS